MICSNTAALAKREAAEDAADRVMDIYGRQAYRDELARIMRDQPEQVLELLADDLIDAINGDEAEFIQAIRDGNEYQMGLVIECACTVIAARLVKDDDVARRAHELEEAA